MQDSDFQDGFAQIIENEQKFLIDRYNGKWRLATELLEIQSDTEAIFLTGELFRTMLPRQVFIPEKLVILSLTGFGINTLPPQIGNLQHLRYLFFRENQLRALPPEIGLLKNLVRIDLTNNHLVETLPIEIAELKSLIILNLSGNKMTKLPLEIGALTRLRTLDLKGNSIETKTTLPWLLPQCEIRF
jgi:Leucine-rich repeat (LRR) protein